ncbi:MAG: hypothetical protein NVSMB53_14270 [Gemmatimonadaceae bacterium]
MDLLLFVERENPDPVKLRAAIQKTFRMRGTHDVPRKFPRPPEGWNGPFAEMASECAVSRDIDAAFDRVSTFLNPVLASGSV